MATTTLTIDADATPMLHKAADALRAIASVHRELADACTAQAEIVEARAIGDHPFVTDPESGDCGECAMPHEHRVHQVDPDEED